MYISSLYMATYSDTRPIDGHFDCKTDAQTVRVEFSADEASRIQEICVEAYTRVQKKLAESILASTPALVALPAPAPSEAIVDGEFTEVEASNDVWF